VVNKRDLNIIT